MTTPRKGQAPAHLTRDAFRDRFLNEFKDPSFAEAQDAVDRLETIAWHNYSAHRKAPLTDKAGPGYEDPDYDLSIEWSQNKARLDAAEAVQKDPSTRSRVLVICASPRNDGTCPGEMSKTFRLSRMACDVFEDAGIQTDLLDLSLVTSEYKRHIHPCKGCASTAMPLCHWPCSCYPNHSLGQNNDWMAEIYERWVAAHGVVIVTPVHWYQVTSPLKLMMDRLVCADGGNPDPTSTSGKNAQKAKDIELGGWSYPKHLAGRVYGVVSHGDVAGIEGVRRSLSDWLDWMGLIDAGVNARLDRFIGYYEPYATSHDTLDADTAMQEEMRNVARAVAEAVHALRQGTLSNTGKNLERPRPK